MKRANGTGAIVKRRDKNRRKPYSVFINGRDDCGKRIRIPLGSFKSHKEAQDVLEKYNQGTYIKPSNETTLKEIWELYKEDKEALTGKPLNANYKSVWKLYIAPRLANEPVENIKTMHMQACINQCDSSVSQKFMKSIFSGLFRYATSNDLVTKDYSAALQVHQTEKSILHKSFTTEEMRWLWQHSKEDIYKVILIQTYTGTRKGELAGMVLDNINLKERYMVGGEKTQAGKNRVIPIADCIYPFVRDFYTISRFAGCQYLIMPDRERGILNQKGMANLDALYRKNFSKHCTHDSRHTFVTMCSNYGQPESVVKKIIGHVGNNITSSVYTHKSTQQLLDVVNSLPFGSEMYIDPSEKSGCHGVATQ